MIFIPQKETLTFSEEEVLRYLGERGEPSVELRACIERVRAECLAVLRPVVCYSEERVEREEDGVQIANIFTRSRALCRNLSGCSRAVVFAATVGIGIDRLLVRYSRTNQLTAAIVQAIGTVCVESLCDVFCNFLAQERKPDFLRPRFSPGYGDFSLQSQREVFALLQPEKKAGITLNSSLLMSPSKSVTAIVGITKETISETGGCVACEKTDCQFKKD